MSYDVRKLNAEIKANTENWNQQKTESRNLNMRIDIELRILYVIFFTLCSTDPANNH